MMMQVLELKQAKKMLGRQWFKQAAARRRVEHEPHKVAAEQVSILQAQQARLD